MRIPSSAYDLNIAILGLRQKQAWTGGELSNRNRMMMTVSRLRRIQAVRHSRRRESWVDTALVVSGQAARCGSILFASMSDSECLYVMNTQFNWVNRRDLRGVCNCG